MTSYWFCGMSSANRNVCIQSTTAEWVPLKIALEKFCLIYFISSIILLFPWENIILSSLNFTLKYFFSSSAKLSALLKIDILTGPKILLYDTAFDFRISESNKVYLSRNPIWNIILDLKTTKWNLNRESQWKFFICFFSSPFCLHLGLLSSAIFINISIFRKIHTCAVDVKTSQTSWAEVFSCCHRQDIGKAG